ncbi:hypothetical protein BBJ28_00013750, partial [Nothophytophthora sp. Chile5]
LVPSPGTCTQLLWHGSRLSNFVGILSQGLRIAPPEAPKNGYYFGKGDGVVVPVGTLKPVEGNQHLLYNEFIVYRREQVRLRYMVTLDFPQTGFGNNKFYMVQLLQDGKSFLVFRKWGRVGAKTPQRYNTSLEKAQQSFQKKFLDKSGNEWPLDGPFEKVEGKYVLVGAYLESKLRAMEIDELSKEASNKETPTAKRPGTRRSTRVKRTSSATATQIRRLKSNLKALSSEFYTLIPHDFGRALPPAIDSMDEVKLKIDLLEVLANLEISQKLQQAKKKAQKKVGSNQPKLNSLDAQYNLLHVDMEPLPEATEEFKIIERYVETTHAPTHVQYKLRIKSVLKIARPDEEKFKGVFQSVPNHKASVLLWHGSRLSNVVGILSKGLRVAPAEAPNNGYMFGKGKKTTKRCTQSGGALRSRLSVLRIHVWLMFVDDNRKDGVVVPIGEFMPSDGSGSLLYNEFIVYRKEQVKLRYLVSLDFAYEEDP